MSKQLVHKKKQELTEKDLSIRKEMFDKYDIVCEVGDIIRDYHGEWPITKIYKRRKKHKDDEDEIIIEWNYEDEYDEPKGKKYKGKGTIAASELASSSYTYLIVAESWEELNSDVVALVAGTETMDSLLNKKFGINEEISESRALAVQSKDVLTDKKKEMVIRRDFVTARMERMREVLDNKRHQLYEMVQKFEEILTRMNKLIFQLEIFLGIKEDIYQVQGGHPAKAKDPVCFRQRMLFMDVECGDPSNDGEGIDFQKTEDFVDWLLSENKYWKKKNYEILIPESKCICVFRVRKEMKDYHVENPFVQMSLDTENRNTYIFMRNGDNIYMIESQLKIGNKLFPNKKEFADLAARMNDPEEHFKDSLQKKIEDKVFDYKLNIILLQGIIERTDIFPDQKYTVNLFDDSVHDSDLIRFIYDDDLSMQLPTGILTFSEWRNKLNENIVEGSRVFLIRSLCAGPHYKEYPKDGGSTFVEDRLFKREAKTWLRWRNIPKRPETGVYQVYEAKGVEKQKYDSIGHYNNQDELLFIKYNPKDKTVAWNRDYWEDDTRKNRLSFEILRKDDFIINYDAINNIELDTLEFYMYTRIGREEYLKYIPILMELYKAKKAEIAREEQFKELIIGGLKWENNKINKVKVHKWIKWWKLKNKWKRGLTTDDAKAYRMIIAKMKRMYR